MSEPNHAVSPYDAAVSIAKRLRERGFQAYFAGGCVRDRILGREPEDYDIATDARPKQVQQLFPRTVSVGAHFGVIVVIERRHSVEVATFRHDVGSSDERHPDRVEFTDAKGDVLRRDFTINGLLYDPVEDKLLDFVEGQKDIEAGIVRAIGDPRERMKEDRLRMLRAVRFASSLGYELDDATAEAIRREAKEIRKVSWERIREEWTKMLTRANPRKGVELMRELELIEPVLPELLELVGVDQPPQYHPEGDCWIHTMLVLDYLPENPSPTLAWSGLLHDIAKPRTYEEAPDRIRFNNHDTLGARMSEQIGKRLKMPGDWITRISWLVRTHLRFKDLPQMRPAKVRRFLSEEGFPEALQLHYADCMASHQKLELHAFCEARLEEYADEPIRPEPLVTGHDLISLGYKPGPIFSEILSAVEDEQLENRVTTKEEGFAWVKKQYPPENSPAS